MEVLQVARGMRALPHSQDYQTIFDYCCILHTCRSLTVLSCHLQGHIPLKDGDSLNLAQYIHILLMVTDLWNIMRPRVLYLTLHTTVTNTND